MNVCRAFRPAPSEIDRIQFYDTAAFFVGSVLKGIGYSLGEMPADRRRILHVEAIWPIHSAGLILDRQQTALSQRIQWWGDGLARRPREPTYLSSIPW